jgi:anti-sigma factor RsiW
MSEPGKGGHLSAEQVEAYQRHTLSPDDLLAVDRHLGGCAGCRRVLLSRRSAVALSEVLSDLPDGLVEPLHPEYEQLSAYVDGRLTQSEAQRIEGHTFLCASCSEEILTLRQLDARLAATPVVITAQVAVKRPAAEPELSLGQRIAQFFAHPGRGRGFGLAFGAIIAGFFIMFQADRTLRSGAAGGGVEDQLVHPATSAHPVFALGGFLLIAAGAAYVLYNIFRNRK